MSENFRQFVNGQLIHEYANIVIKQICSFQNVIFVEKTISVRQISGMINVSYSAFLDARE